jgi:translation initiation factor IF-1
MIRLDARLVDMLPPAAFVGELENGHRIVAYFRHRDRVRLPAARVGDTVTVELSPYDMSKGAIVPEDREGHHESQNVGQKNV